MSTPEAVAQGQLDREMLETIRSARQRARLDALLGGAGSETADAAADRAEIELARVWVPPHERVDQHGRVHVEGYFYDRRTKAVLPAPVRDRRLATNREHTVERARGVTRASGSPGVSAQGSYTRPARGQFTKPLEPEAAAARERDAHDRLRDARRQGLSSDTMYRRMDSEGNPQWATERAFQHNQIIDSLLHAARKVPRERQAVVMGGAPGSGKSETVRRSNQLDSGQYMKLDPDAIKTEMARRNMVPFVDGLTPMEASPLVHTEAGDILDGLGEAAHREGINVLWDVTMSRTETVDYVTGRLDHHGYDTDALFVRASDDSRAKRVATRWQEGMESWLSGDTDAYGGRLVPTDIARGRDARGRSAENVFEDARSRFRRWWRYANDTDGEDPVLIDSSEPVAPGPTAPDSRPRTDPEA